MPTDGPDFSSQVKALVADRCRRIELDDLIGAELDAAATSLSEFTLDQPDFIPDAATDRLSRMIAATRRVRAIAVLVARWGHAENLPSLQRIISRLADANERNSGLNGWISLSWFPFMATLYAAGVTAFASQRFDSLTAILRAPSGRKSSSDDHDIAYCLAYRALMKAGRRAFNILPQYTHHHVALSEFLAATLSQELHALVGIGTEFDDSFDQFEVLQTLSFSHDIADPSHFGGLYGRFVYRDSYNGGPFKRIALAAELNGNCWGPIAAGLFGGDLARFREVEKRYREEVLPTQRQHG